MDATEGLLLVDGQAVSSQILTFDRTHRSYTVTVQGVQDYNADGTCSYQLRAQAVAGIPPARSAAGSWAAAIRTFDGGTDATSAHYETLYNDPDGNPDRDVGLVVYGDA